LFIFVLGATETEEQLEPGHWGEISLFDPTINYCIYLVGPEISQGKHQASLKVSDKIALWYWKDYYHNFRSHQFTHGWVARAGTMDPDLFVMCNSTVGRHTSDWMPSLLAILHSPVPAVLTASSEEELNCDVKLLKAMNAKFILQPVANAFASLRTRLNSVTLNIMQRANMYMFAIKAFDGEAPKHMSSVANNPSEFVQQWDSLINRQRDILVHLPMSLVGPFLKTPKSGIPALWKEIEKDHGWFIKFTELNKNLLEAKMQKAEYVTITSSIDGLEKSYLVQITKWDVTCFQCGAKGMLCCSRCKLLWYCTVDCRKVLNDYHKYICETVRKMTNEESDLLVLEDVAHNSEVMNLLKDKVPRYISSLVSKSQ